jgi:hypothetical protein
MKKNNLLRIVLIYMRFTCIFCVFIPFTNLKGQSLFYKHGTNVIDDFSAVSNNYSFDIVNQYSDYLMLIFEASTSAELSPKIVRLAPDERATVKMILGSGVNSFKLIYDISLSPELVATTHRGRYRAISYGETVMTVPVKQELYKSLKSRAEEILSGSKELVTDSRMPKGTYIYTPGPFYRDAGLFARDFLYQLEGSGGYLVTMDEVKRAVDFLLLNQLKENTIVGNFTFPKGAIPDHAYPDGRYAWGPGLNYGEVPGRFNRPSMDESMCFITLAWHYGYKANWNKEWQSWFKANSSGFTGAWESVPRNPNTGLVTQWVTPRHTGANGINEYDGACVTWGFHDSYALGGDDIGTSILACNAARALADMFEKVSDSLSLKKWRITADDMRNSIRAQFNSAGYLPWGVGNDTVTPKMASPDYTGYAVWSGILTDSQADAASDWFASNYKADKAQGGLANLFNMQSGYRGTVRMARKSDDVYPGKHIWPHVIAPLWENLAYGYNAYQDGGYWYYKSDGIALTLWRKHPEEAKEWVNNTYSDIINNGIESPYERIDWNGPVNGRYNASIGPVLGMGMPAITYSITVVKKNKK